jgi:hypothetical protein
MRADWTRDGPVTYTRVGQLCREQTVMYLESRCLQRLEYGCLESIAFHLAPCIVVGADALRAKARAKSEQLSIRFRGIGSQR